jgi:DNA-binding transcriptional ArsR family regulator
MIDVQRRTEVTNRDEPDVMSRLAQLVGQPARSASRRAIFERLCREGEKTVGALTARAGVSQPVVSKHLGVLKQAGLVRGRQDGRQTHYSAQLGALAPIIDWTSQMTGFWQSRFDKLEDLLKRMDQ